MKLEIILAIAWTSLCIGERLQRSTVLTDESKRVLEHFDFSNFDKQEALNYIDRQRYENQIRGKRSHNKCKRHHTDGNKEPLSDKDVEDNDSLNEIEDNSSLTPQIIKKSFQSDEKDEIITSDGDNPICEIKKFKKKQCCRGKRKRKSKKNSYVERGKAHEEYDEYEDDRRLWKRKRRKRKRRYWNHWTSWTPCSVTCGRGRKIRWRKCVVKNCKNGEWEMGEKTCQLPACNLLTKLLGI